jgi:(1->4)-alpha-D-glucan 1-alpha-D-glucosylmutase
MIGTKRPDPADEIMLYQMIVGAWPTKLDPSDADGCQAYADRLAGWQQKALREAKLRTDWTAPNEDYETLSRNFLTGLFARESAFLPLARSFVDRIAPAGAVNGLVQTVLKTTVPGMPDFFQGTEFWDFSLVDPDNRRPVDYAARQTALATHADPVECLATWRSGQIKQVVIQKLLGLRRRVPQLFARGDYSPMPVAGAFEDRFIAFTRTYGGSVLIVVVPRLVLPLLRNDDGITLDPHNIDRNTLSFPEQLHGRAFESLLTKGQTITAQSSVPVHSLLADFPLAVLYAIDSA